MPKALEKELMKVCKERGYSKERCDRYVYGTLRKTGWKPKKRK
jgi:hypothetical protein